MTILFDSRLNKSAAAWTRIGTTFSNGVDVMSVNQEVSRPSAYEQVADVDRGLVWRINARPSDLLSDKIRNELSAPNTGVNSIGPPRDNSGTYMLKLRNLWYRWSFKFPADAWFATGATKDRWDCVVIQQHDTPGTASRVAPLHLLLVNDELQLRNSFSTTVDYDRLLWRARAQIGVWYDCVLQAFLDDTAPATGYLRWWVNGRKVFHEDNALNTYATDNSPGPWPKDAGIYYPHGMPPGFPGTALMSEGMVVGDGYATYNAFMGACGLADTEREMTVRGGINLG